MSQFIVAGEIVKIHHYLFKAPRLRYMAGGSILIETFSTVLVPELAEKLEPGAKVYLAAAGRFMVGFNDNNKAEQFAAMIRFAGKYLFGGENCLVCEPLVNDNKIIRKVADELERMKISAREKPVSDMAGLQYMERCGECGTWGADKREIMGNETVSLCRLCHLKYQARGGNIINIAFPQVLQADGMTGITLCQNEKTKETGEINGSALPVTYSQNPYHKRFESFIEIAGKSDPPYIGVFYADGNEMGTLISECEGLEAYSAFSDKISKANKAALDAAADKVNLKDDHDNNYFPGLILIQGGDDLLAVLPADKVVDFAITFMDKAAAVDSPLKKGICGGLVFSPPNMPFNGLYELADALCTNGKNKMWFLKKESTEDSPTVLTTPKEQSAIDYMLVTSAMIEDIGDIKERQIYQKPDKTYTFFTARPYCIGEFNELTNKIRKFKEVAPPRRVFMDLKDIFLPGELDSTDRIDEKGGFRELQELVLRLGKLYPGKKDVIDSFFLDEKLLAPKTWKAKNSDGIDKNAARVWQADIVELVDFIKTVVEVRQ